MFEDADMRVIKMSELKLVVRWIQSIFKPGGGGGLPYESDGDAPKIRINTLKETNLGLAPALFNP